MIIKTWIQKNIIKTLRVSKAIKTDSNALMRNNIINKLHSSYR